MELGKVLQSVSFAKRSLSCQVVMLLYSHVQHSVSGKKFENINVGGEKWIIFICNVLTRLLIAEHQC